LSQIGQFLCPIDTDRNKALTLQKYSYFRGFNPLPAALRWALLVDRLAGALTITTALQLGVRNLIA